MNSIGDKLQSCHTKKKYEVTEVGVMYPDQQKTDVLFAGQVGYITCNMKNSSEGQSDMAILTHMII